MKLIARAFVLCLAVSGAVAGIVSSHSAKAQTPTMNHQVFAAALPAPSCPLNDPKGCGIRGGR